MVKKAILGLSTLFLAAGAAAEARVASPFMVTPVEACSAAPQLTAASAQSPFAATPTQPPGQRQFERELLLWQAPLAAATSPADTWVDVDVEIFGDGALLHREALRVERPEQGKVGVVEVLARDPDERRVLRGMAERGRVQVEARFVVDGVEAERLPLAHLLEAPQVAEGSQLDYLAVRFRDPGILTVDDIRRMTAAGEECDCSARDACLTQCQQDYHDCLDSGVCAPQIRCAECDEQRFFCQESCPPCECTCTEPKSVTTRYETYLVDGFYTGYWQCYEDPWENDFIDGWWYREWVWVYRQDEIRVTENCDGTKTEQVVGSTYFYFYCYQNTWLSCSYPYWWPPATC
jgi:hypothetical protein